MQKPKRSLEVNNMGMELWSMFLNYQKKILNLDTLKQLQLKEVSNNEML